jgi:hypothetical protein
MNDSRYSTIRQSELRQRGFARASCTPASILGLLLLALVVGAPSAFADDGVVFESHASGTTAGGGVLIGSGKVLAHSFRLTQTTHISALGAMAESSSGTLYAALYRIDNTHDTFDAVGNADLLATTVLSPGDTPADVSGPVSVTVPPGWYAIGVGIGRHGATAGHFQAFLPDLDNTEAANSFGPYAISTSDNSRTLYASSWRFFVLGHGVADPAPSTDFSYRSAEPWAFDNWDGMTMNANSHFANRFEIGATAHVYHVGAWLAYGNGGSVFAAIVRLPTADAYPPLYGTQNFDDALVGTTLIEDVGFAPDEYSGSFPGLELTPGHYALIFGSGRFGATGTAGLMTLHDGGLGSKTFAYGGSYWADLQPPIYTHMTLSGLLPTVQANPDPVAFAPGAIGGNQQQNVTLTNTGVLPIQIDGLNVTGANQAMFTIGDPNGCVDAPLAAAAQCTFTIAYSPQTAASHVADLRVASNGSPDPLVVPLSGSSVGLDVDIDDGGDYAAYATTRHYVLTVTNTSDSEQSDIAVTATLPAQLDATTATWSCVTGCNASGIGNLSDQVASLAVGASVVYAIDAPVKADAAGDTTEVDATATASSIGPFTGKDTDTLVIFRDGFDNE